MRQNNMLFGNNDDNLKRLEVTGLEDNEKAAVVYLLERFLNEGKSIFVYRIIGGSGINEKLDIDSEVSARIWNIMNIKHFEERIYQSGELAKISFFTACAIIKYKEEIYLIEHKKMDTYSRIFLYYQVTPMKILEIR